jgi:quinol monooxygenase YgiN
MGDTVYTIVEVTVQDGTLDEALAILNELAEETRKEPGSEAYLCIRDDTRPNTLLSYERWRSAEDEAAHWQTPHLERALGLLSAVLVGEPVVHKGPRVV